MKVTRTMYIAHAVAHIAAVYVNSAVTKHRIYSKYKQAKSCYDSRLIMTILVLPFRNAYNARMQIPTISRVCHFVQST